MDEMTAAAIRTENDPRWQSVLGRDRAADGSFVFAVRTTGIYCRPSCPARAARPENVTFFDGPEAAEAAGFRACLRCHPKALSGPAEFRTELIAEACRILAQAPQKMPLEEIADRIGLSARQFHRLFRDVTGLTPARWAEAHRAERLRTALSSGETSVTEAIFEAGFASTGRFYAAADGILGMTPSAWKDGGAGEEIRFATGDCRLGALLVAKSSRGICAISLGDAPEPLIAELRQRFSQASLVAEPTLGDHLGQVIGMIDGAQAAGGGDLPLDLRGTAFQIRVWQALREIPRGSAVSYAELANRIGAPRAVRAVAGACAANVLAVAVPCHRVVRSDGSLSGYRWGVARKRDLLAREGIVLPSGDDGAS